MDTLTGEKVASGSETESTRTRYSVEHLHEVACMQNMSEAEDILLMAYRDIRAAEGSREKFRRLDKFRAIRMIAEDIMDGKPVSDDPGFMAIAAQVAAFIASID